MTTRGSIALAAVTLLVATSPPAGRQPAATGSLTDVESEAKAGQSSR